MYRLLPDFNLCCGYRPFKTFISGTSIILSNDVSKKITPLINTNSNSADDNVINDILVNYYKQKDIEDYNFTLKFFINNEIISDTDTYDYKNNNILFYRIKNNNRRIDIEIFKKLICKIYNI